MKKALEVANHLHTPMLLCVLVLLVNYMRVTGSELCVNGPDQGELANGTLCNCTIQSEEYFNGDNCEILNLTVTHVKVTARTVNFTWPSNPNIDEKRYEFIYQKVVELKVYREAFTMLDSRTARLINLDSGEVDYIICVVKVNTSWPTEPETDDQCVSVTTDNNGLRPYTIGAVLVGTLMAVTILVLMVIGIVTFIRAKRVELQEKFVLGDNVSVHTIGSVISTGMSNRGREMNTTPTKQTTRVANHFGTNSTLVYNNSTGMSTPLSNAFENKSFATVEIDEPAADYD